MKRTLLVILSAAFVWQTTAQHGQAKQISPLATAHTHLEIQGHRGARAVLPENSLPGFLYTLLIGADTIELDLGVTADGVVVVVHDQQINTTLCQRQDEQPLESGLWVHQTSLAFIQSLDCASKGHAGFTRQRKGLVTHIPTLDQVFSLIKSQPIERANTVLFNIETKSDPRTPHAQPAPREFIAKVLAVVRKHNLESRVTIQSFDHRTLREAFVQAPDIQRAALFREKPDNWIAAAQKAKAQIVSPMATLIDQHDVASLQAQGLRVIPWTVNEPEHWDYLINMGVDGIITDDPSGLLKHVGRTPPIDLDDFVRNVWPKVDAAQTLK